MPKTKYYIVFAGVNGAGKSTFYHSNMWRRQAFSDDMKRVNSDEILRDQGGDSNSEKDQLKAMRYAVSLIKEYFDGGISFNQETTLAGRKSVQDIKQAKVLGYQVIMFYIGVNTPMIAHERVAHRAAIGGHDIPSDFIKRRYYASMQNLVTCIDICDEVFLFDNSNEMRTVGIYNNGRLILDLATQDDAWVKSLFSAGIE